MNIKTLILLLLITLTNPLKYFTFKVQKESEGMYFYGNIKILNHTKIKTVILDTGSSVLGVPCTQATIDKYKKINDKPEPFHLNFAEGSEIRGNTIVEKIRINSEKDKYLTLPASNIACIMSRDGLFRKQFANGIIGLNYSSEFLRGFDKNMTMNLQFCLAEKEGFVYFFKNEPSENEWDFEFGFNDFFSGYSIAFKKVVLGGRVIVEKNYQVNIDYGTTYLFLPNQIFAEFFKGLNLFCKEEERNCATYDSMNVNDCIEFSMPDDIFNGIDDMLSSFPKLTFRVEEKGVVHDLTINPHQYFWYDENDEEVEEGAEKICMGMREHQFHFVILGNNTLRNKKVFVDRNNMLVKVKEVDCEEVMASPLKLSDDDEKKLIV